jgi:hypothetical protein
MDFAFPGFEHVYGIPEHADSFALKSTKWVSFLYSLHAPQFICDFIYSAIIHICLMSVITPMEFSLAEYSADHSALFRRNIGMCAIVAVVDARRVLRVREILRGECDSWAAVRDQHYRLHKHRYRLHKHGCHERHPIPKWLAKIYCIARGFPNGHTLQCYQWVLR